jgi:hypothetical protein
MASVNDPRFGAFDPSVSGFWDATLTYGDRQVEIDLTIDGNDLNADTLQSVLRRSEDLAKLDPIARDAIHRNAESGEESSAIIYYEHHLEELEATALRSLFGTEDREAIDSSTFFSKLALVRVGLYPENEDAQILLDYSLGTDITNYVLCVSFDTNGEISAVDLES